MKEKKHIPQYNITYVQNRMNKDNYVNSYIITKDKSFVIDIFDNNVYDIFTKKTIGLLRSYAMLADKRSMYTGYNPIIGTYTIKFLNTQPVSEKEKAIKRANSIVNRMNNKKENLTVDKSLLNTELLLEEPIRWRILTRLYYYYKSESHINNIHYKFNIQRPVHYVKGIDDTDEFDNNSVYFFINEDIMHTKIKSLITDANHNVKNAEHKMLSEIYDTALALFMINMTYELSWKDLNINSIMFMIVNILNYSFDYSVDWININHRVFVNKLKKYLEKSISNGWKFEAYRLARKFSFNINQCMFPEEWTKEMKAEFKLNHCIMYNYPNTNSWKGKQRKDYDKNKVIDMYNNKCKVKDICSECNISKPTYSKIIKEYLSKLL